eukprot:505807_1
MSDEKEIKYNQDIEEKINDGYKYVEQTDNLLASGSSSKRSKQNDSNKDNAKIEILKKLITITRSEETDKIQKCIGQVTISYDGNNNAYRYGTGTIYKHLDGKYYLMITCAHNVVYFNDRNNKKQYAKKLFYLPNGIQDEDTRLICIEWIAHPNYNPNITHCPYDIGIVLCYDPRKYCKKNNLNVNEFIRINNWNKNQLKHCKIFGYPVKCEGQLMGREGIANKDNNEWKYTINTYPGQSGSSLYKVKELDDGDEIYTIYGIHTFGNIDQNINRGVYLDQNRIKWIKQTENVMNEKMNIHKQAKKKDKKVNSNEITIF